MKKLLTILFLFSFLIFTLFPSGVKSQNHWSGYWQMIPIEEYEGLNFRFTASVRTEVVDDSASAQLWLRVDTHSGNGFFENMDNRPIRDNHWKEYEIQGVIDSTAHQIVFGTICSYNGNFYYDNFKLEVLTNNNWETIFNMDFEGDSSNVVNGIMDWGSSDNDKFDSNIFIEENGNQCMVIVGKEVPNFGISKEAGRFAEVNGIELYYEIYGKGQPLIVLHGNGGSIAYASTHYPYFIERGYKVIAIDSRAQGRSGDSEEELTYRLMASDVNALLDILNLDSVYIWGHSDGGIVGLILALYYPSKVKKLISFAPNVQADTNSILPEIYQWIEKRELSTQDIKEKKRVTMMLNYPNIPFDELSKIKAEVLIMSGDRDFTPLSHTIHIFENIPKAHLCIIPGATHAASWEKRDLFLQLASDFYEKPFRMPSTIDMLY